MMSLLGKSGIVFGGTGTIGTELVAQLLALRCGVTVACRGMHSRSTLLSRTATLPAQPDFVTVDVTIQSQVANAFQVARDRWSMIDFSICCPGLTPDVEVPLSQYPAAQWSTNIDVYATGFLYCFQESMLHLRPGGHIVAISSAITRFSSTSLPPINAGHYAASKAALNELCKWARRDAHHAHLLLSRIAPGAVDSAAQQALPQLHQAVLPVSDVARRVIFALNEGIELDEEILPD